MRKRYAYALGLIVAVGLLAFNVPAMAAPRAHPATPRSPKVSTSWVNGASFTAAFPYRWDGEYYAAQNRVYFLGYRNVLDNLTYGEIWYYDVATQTFVDDGVAMPVPVSNYEVSALTDAQGKLGFYIFGGRDANANVVNTVQVFYPATNTTATITTDPFPGTTPSGCVSLPAMGVATLANHAIITGGLAFTANGCVADENSAQTWIYFPKKAAGARWKQGPDLTLARGYITDAVIGKTVYAIGGDTNVAGTLFPQPTVEKWLAPSGVWDDAGVADLPVSPGCDESQAFPFTSGPLANDIVLAGCGQWPNDVPDVWLLNTVANTWTDSGLLNNSRRNQAGAFIGAKMYIFGGVTAGGGTGVQITEIGTGHAFGAARPGYTRPAAGLGGNALTS